MLNNNRNELLNALKD